MTTSTAPGAWPEIVTQLPGPKTQVLLEKDHQYLSPSYTRGYPLSIERGEGPMVWDLDGNRFLDFCAGIATCSTGHSHPEVVKTVQAQAAKFLHMSGTDFYYQVMADLAERLAKSAPGDCERRVYFGNSGTEAVEAAMKLARYKTGRPYFISFFRSFHGRTYGAMSLTASKSIQKKSFSPLVPCVHHAHYPYPYRDETSVSPEECADKCLDYITHTLFKHVVPADEVAAFIVEPVQGEGGYVVPPKNFLTGLQQLAERHGILIIADEVQSGVGRTGKMWASDHFDGFVPDMMTSAKGLASGLPLGAMIARADVMDWEPGMHASTFGGNPVSCAAALKTLDLLEGGLLQNAADVGAYLKQRLQGLAQQHDVIGEVRGLGLMIGLEIVKSKETQEKAPALRDKIVDDCFYQGLLILGCGENSLRLSPSLVISRDHADAAVDILDRVLKNCRA